MGVTPQPPPNKRPDPPPGPPKITSDTKWKCSYCGTYINIEKDRCTNCGAYSTR
jgi:rubrerythrin